MNLSLEHGRQQLLRGFILLLQGLVKI